MPLTKFVCRSWSSLLTHLGLVVVVVAVQCGAGETFNRRIYGGNPVMETELPYQAAITVNNNIVVCGGAVLSSTYVVTAGHCVEQEGMLVRVGSSSLHRRGSWHKVTDLATLFTNASQLHDIALLRVKPPMRLGSRVKKIRLPNPNDPPPKPGTFLTISGWGLVNAHSASSILKRIKMKVVSEEACRKQWPFIGPERICMGPKRPTGTCAGDSGGPLVNEHGVLQGLLSYGTKDCSLGSPEVYTPIKPYFHWLMKAKQMLDKVWSVPDDFRREADEAPVEPPEVIVLGPGVKHLHAPDKDGHTCH